MKVVILAGGLGTRLREETDYKPKPMVEIGGKPIILHIINHFLKFGLNEFIIATGYRGEVIKNYFCNFDYLNNDIILNIDGENRSINLIKKDQINKLNVSVIDTGIETNTGGRLLRLRKLLEDKEFICTYGDGLSNVDIGKLINFHMNSSKIATVTAVKPLSRFGILALDGADNVCDFKEKNQIDEWINGGYFVFKPKIFNYLSEESTLEIEPMTQLTKESELNAFKHFGFWQPMDTYREFIELNRLWKSGDAPWTS